jgi:hypothetical protein
VNRNLLIIILYKNKKRRITKNNFMSNKRFLWLIATVVAAATIIAAVVFACSKQTEATSKVESYQHVKERKLLKRSPYIQLTATLCVYVDITCTHRVTATDSYCIIDGNYCIFDCNNGYQSVVKNGTYHLENHGNCWAWANCSCIPNTTSLPTGVTVNDLVGITNDPSFL